MSVNDISKDASQCPIDHNKLKKEEDTSKCPIDHTKLKEEEESSKCPIDHNNKSKATWMNLASESSKLNPSNLMYSSEILNQDANSTLKEEREISSIPKYDTSDGEEKWVYPSEKMFFNAMKRKHFKPKENDMKSVVPIHNLVNERAWWMILKYEEKYKSVCEQPKLIRFQGRPNEPSPKARMKNILGYTLPFDRHDWYVDRCGVEVRYVIDFYTGKQQSDNSLPSFYLDARPAIDNLNNLVDRMSYFFKNLV